MTMTQQAPAPTRQDQPPGRRTRHSAITSRGPARNITLLAITLGILIYPAIVPGYRADKFSQALVYAMIGLSVNILMGYAGQISLGHQAFVGVGAFTAAYMVTVAEVPFALSVLVAGLVGAATAAILGVVALRIQGLYLALITLAYGAVAERSIFGIQELTGGGAGQAAERPGFISGDAAYAYLCLAVLAVLLFIDWRMLRTKFGRALLTLKSNEQVAASFGMNLVFYKIAAFVIAGGFAGIAGGLFAFRTQRVVSQDFEFATALTFVIMVVIGGLGSRIGVVIGSMFTSYLPSLLDGIGQSIGIVRPFGVQVDFNKLIVLKIAISALLLLLTVTRFPGGIAQQLHPFTEWLSGKPFPHHEKEKKTKKPKKAHGARGHKRASRKAPAKTPGAVEGESPDVPT